MLAFYLARGGVTLCIAVLAGGEPATPSDTCPAARAVRAAGCAHADLAFRGWRIGSERPAEARAANDNKARCARLVRPRQTRDDRARGARLVSLGQGGCYSRRLLDASPAETGALSRLFRRFYRRPLGAVRRCPGC